MSALIKGKGNKARDVKHDLRPLAANVKALKGGAVMCITASTGKGYYAPADSAKTGVVVGIFDEDADNTGGLIGAVSANVDHQRERKVQRFANDTGTPLTVADREALCYALDDQTATGAVGSVALGVLYDVSADGSYVWVELSAEPAGAEIAPGISAVAPVDPSSSAASAGSATLAAAQDHLHHIALATPASEGLMSGAQASAITLAVANIAALKGIGATGRAAGMLALVLAGTSGGHELWRFHATSTAADTSENLVVSPTVGTGKWLRADGSISMSLAVDKTTADAATIFTVPVGVRLRVKTAWWDVTTSWSGGTNSAIGVHASPSGYTAKGAILGGSGGDVQATLVSTNTREVGTVGSALGATDRLILIAADTIKFDRIVDLFTAGAANVRVACDVLLNPGA